MSIDQENAHFRVLINEEHQYSLWPAQKGAPPGWRDVGIVGNKQQCLNYIEEVWVDMRPLSLRNQMSLHTQDRS